MGSPPRVRGKVCLDKFYLRLNGITPACAGKRSSAVWSSCAQKDHPRVCGEKPRGRPAGQRALGSPPRVRGKGYQPASKAAPVRITPACAGKRHFVSSHLHAARDHPRVCGEKNLKYTKIPENTGSPPRVRGKVDWRIRCRLIIGITPACAGKSSELRLCKPEQRDHPRVCGEKGE